MKQTLCRSYFAIGRTQLIEFWILNRIWICIWNCKSLSDLDLDFEMKLSDWNWI